MSSDNLLGVSGISKSRNLEDDIIIQLKTWLNIEPSEGCPYSCLYCFRHDDDDFEKTIPKAITSVEVLVNSLENHQFFVPDETHLSINGTKSDAFLPQNKKTTFELLDALEQKGYSNMVTVVTKSYLDDDDAKRLESFRSIRPVIFVTYSAMPTYIEPVSGSRRIESLKNLSDVDVPALLYWRPLIDGHNTSDAQIEAVIEAGELYADAFVLSGLRLSPEIVSYFKKEDVALPDNPWVAGHKYISPETLERIYRIYSEKGCKKPLFKKSSCAASYIEQMPDFNAHWSNSSKNCSPFCPQKQKIRCKGQSTKILPYDVVSMIPDLSREEKTFFRHKYKLPVK